MPLKYERVGSEEGNFKIKRKPRNFRMEQEVTPTWKPISGMEERAKSKKTKNKKKKQIADGSELVKSIAEKKYYNDSRHKTYKCRNQKGSKANKAM